MQVGCGDGSSAPWRHGPRCMEVMGIKQGGLEAVENVDLRLGFKTF